MLALFFILQILFELCEGRESNWRFTDACIIFSDGFEGIESVRELWFGWWCWRERRFFCHGGWFNIIDGDFFEGVLVFAKFYVFDWAEFFLILFFDSDWIFKLFFSSFFWTEGDGVVIEVDFE